MLSNKIRWRRQKISLRTCRWKGRTKKIRGVRTRQSSLAWRQGDLSDDDEDLVETGRHGMEATTMMRWQWWGGGNGGTVAMTRHGSRSCRWESGERCWTIFFWNFGSDTKMTWNQIPNKEIYGFGYDHRSQPGFRLHHQLNQSKIERIKTQAKFISKILIIFIHQTESLK